MNWNNLFLSICLLAQWPVYGQGEPQPSPERLARFAEAERAMEEGKDSLSLTIYVSSTLDAEKKEAADSLTALAYHRIATHYFNVAEDSLAMPWFRKSLALRDSLFPGPHNDRAHIRTNMGMSMLYYGDLDSAIVLTQEANEIYESLEAPDSVNWLKSLNELGLHALTLEDYALGYGSSHRAVEICESLDGVDPFSRFITYYRAARVLSHFEEYPTALRHAQAALAEASELGDWRNMASCHNLVGLIYREMDDMELSARNLNQALEDLQDVKGASIQRAHAYLYLAEHYGKLNQDAQRKRYDNLARSEFSQTGGMDPYYLRTQLADVSLEHQNYTEALDLLKETLGYLRANRQDIPSTRTVQVINALFLRARTYAALDSANLAIADYEEAFTLQDGLRQQTADPASRRYLGKDLRPDMDRAVALYYRQYAAGRGDDYLWRAFEISERSRAFSLLASQRQRRGSHEEVTLKRQIADLERKVARGNLSYRSELEGQKIRLARLLRNRSDEEVPVLKFSSAHIRQYLRDKQTHLLEYHLSDNLNLAFLLSATGELSAFQLEADSTLYQMVETWNEAIVASSFRRKSLRPAGEQRRLDSTFLHAGLALTRQLIPDELLSAIPESVRLCIVPDYSLNYVPFAALPMDWVATYPLNYRDIRYLQDHAHISYAYSGSYLAAIDTAEAPLFTRDLLAFAPAFGAGQPDSDVRSASGIDLETKLAPLRYNQEEAMEIAALLPNAEVFSGIEASRAAFLQSVGGSRILHLSTHGVANPQHPELSFVAFNHFGEETIDEKELLYFNDLYALPMDSELTVLSACETSLGKLAPGETPLSFASAFAAAGARSTLTTLWQVDDRATKEMMVEFYRQLLAGTDRVVALDRSQRHLREQDYFHPYYWAAPTLYGATAAMNFSPADTVSFGAFTWSGVTVACLAIVALFSLLHSRKS